MTEGYGVTPELLQQTAKGINDTIGELKKLGIDESGEIGRGFSRISLRGMQVGHQGLEQAFADFCERWSWGVRTMVQDGSEFAAALHLSAGEYYDAEQYGIGVLKDVAGGIVGDPHKTDDQVEKESWGDIAHQANPLNADYSAKSVEQLGDDASRTWRTEARDFSDGPMGIYRYAEDATGTREHMEQTRDQVFGSDTRGDWRVNWFSHAVDKIGDGIEHGVTDVEHEAGKVVDSGAHLLGGGLDKIGLHGAAQEVDSAGDAVADHLGAEVAEQQLGQTEDPAKLVHATFRRSRKPPNT